MAEAQDRIVIIHTDDICRICVKTIQGTDQNYIDLLNPEPTYEKNELFSLVSKYFNVKLDDTDAEKGKTTKLCLPCLEHLRLFRQHYRAAQKGQVVIDFLRQQEEINPDLLKKLQKSMSAALDVTKMPSVSNYSISNSIAALNITNCQQLQRPTITCPFCKNYEKPLQINANNFCSKHSTPFTCLVPQCFLVFPNMRTLIPHYRAHLCLDKQTYMCHKCLDVLNCPRKVMVTNHTHQNLENLMRCCGIGFLTMTEFVCHKLQIHNAEVVKSLLQIKGVKCTDPNIEPLNQNLKRNTKTEPHRPLKMVARPKIATDGGIRPIETVVSTSTVNTGEIMRPVETVVSTRGVDTVTNETMVDMYDALSLTGEYPCNVCGNHFNSVRKLVDHSKSLHNNTMALKEKEIKYCPLCDENYEVQIFVEHINLCTSTMQVGNGDYGCASCGKILKGKTASLFRNHYNFCKSFEQVVDASSNVIFKCKNCVFECTDSAEGMLHANAYCIYYKLKTKYATLPWEKEMVTRRVHRQERLEKENCNWIKSEKGNSNNPSFCDWSRQKILGSYMFYCNLCKKGFFSLFTFINHLTSVGVKCRPQSLQYCTRCLCDFESKAAYDEHVPRPTPPTAINIKPEILNIKPEILNIKPEIPDGELNGTTELYNEENIENIINSINDQQCDDDNQETKVYDFNEFQESEVPNLGNNGTLFEKALDFSQFLDNEFSDDEDDKFNLNIIENVNTP